MTQTVTVTQASIADLIEQRDELLEALKPFARMGDIVSRYGMHSGKFTLAEKPWAQHFLRAAEVYAAKNGSSNNEPST